MTFKVSVVVDLVHQQPQNYRHFPYTTLFRSPAPPPGLRGGSGLRCAAFMLLEYGGSPRLLPGWPTRFAPDRVARRYGKSTRMNSSHTVISSVVICLKKIKMLVMRLNYSISTR